MHEQALAAWVRNGHAGGMTWMVKDGHRRARPQEVLPGARSIIALATNYFQEPNPPPSDRGALGRVARYAYGRDYHTVIGKRLKTLTQWLQGEHPESRFKSYVDTGPVLERAVAHAAGLGFIGKNTTLITKTFGSWVFLSVVLTDLELESDSPAEGDCGSCALCLESCPTGAIIKPYVLDSRQCISYWTIESRAPEIPKEIARASGDWVFGCDICQEVCPINRDSRRPLHRQSRMEPHPQRRFAPGIPETRTVEFHPSAGVGAWLPLKDLERRAVPLSGTPLKRAGSDGLARNALAIRRGQGWGKTSN